MRMKALQVSILLFGIFATSSLQANTDEAKTPIEQAREHALEITQQELEKGTISKQIAEEIFELMNLLALLIPVLEDEKRVPIQITSDFFGATNECYDQYFSDGSSNTICY